MCYNYCALLQTGIEWSASQMLNKYWFAHWLIPLTKILCFKIATTCHQGLLSCFKNISYLGHFILARSEGISRALSLPVPVWEKKEALASWLMTLHPPTCPSLSSGTTSPLLKEEPWECCYIGHLGMGNRDCNHCLVFLLIVTWQVPNLTHTLMVISPPLRHLVSKAPCLMLSLKYVCVTQPLFFWLFEVPKSPF